jgi:hypothetical protein
MAAAPYRSTVTIDGTKFDAVSTVVVFQTDKDRAGMPQMGSLQTQIRVYVDFHDDTNLPYSGLNKLFNLANVVTRDKVKSMKVEFWKDDSHQDALCSYSFNGWIAGFHTCNPANGHTSAADSTDVSNVNHLLVLDLEPALNQQNFQDITMGN